MKIDDLKPYKTHAWLITWKDDRIESFPHPASKKGTLQRYVQKLLTSEFIRFQGGSPIGRSSVDHPNPTFTIHQSCPNTDNLSTNHVALEFFERVETKDAQASEKEQCTISNSASKILQSTSKIFQHFTSKKNQPYLDSVQSSLDPSDTVHITECFRFGVGFV